MPSDSNELGNSVFLLNNKYCNLYKELTGPFASQLLIEKCNVF